MKATPAHYGSPEIIEPFWTDLDEQGGSMLQLVAIHANDGIWGWDVATGRSYYSARWWELVGRRGEGSEAHIDTFVDLLHPDDRTRIQDALDRFVSGADVTYRVEFRLRHANGDWRWILSSGSAQRDEHGRAIRIAGTHTDITERVETADRLERLVADRTQDLLVARDRAELAATATAKFLSTTSHDIRQPLQAMALLLGSLQAEPLSSSGRDTLDAVRRSLLASMALLDDLLEFSRLDAGALRPTIGNVDIGQMLLAALDGYSLQARERGLRFTVRPTTLIGRSDAQLIGRIVRNLVSNSFKFTASGTVLVAARPRGKHVRIEVWDTGSGVSKDMQRQIFWEFMRGDGAMRADHDAPGLGLGLAIVDRLARLLGHQIGVRSVPGQGSVFWVELPRAKVADTCDITAEIGTPQMPKLPDGCRLALVENDAEIAQAFVGLLRSWGGKVTWARSGDSLLSQIANEKPDLLIADWHIDGPMDGFAVFDRLEQRFGKHMPGIILSGDQDFDRLMTANRSMRRILHKPILPEVLNAVLRAELAS